MADNDFADVAERPDANLTDGNDGGAGGVEFVLSSSPLVAPPENAPSSSRAPGDYELGELPRSYGQSLLVAIARDPHTLFVYWDLDWPRIFGDRRPADRKVHLRVHASDGSQEMDAVVEPLASSHCLTVARARASYRVEIGYEEPAGIWNSVAISNPAATPPDDIGEDGPIDVATVPFHLSFQRIVDAFRGSQYDGDALVEVLGRLQEKADDPHVGLDEGEREILRALDLNLPDDNARDRARLRQAGDSFATRQRVESILGFGATSPM